MPCSSMAASIAILAVLLISIKREGAHSGKRFLRPAKPYMEPGWGLRFFMMRIQLFLLFAVNHLKPSFMTQYQAQKTWLLCLI